MTDGGRSLSGEGIARFVREWNERNPNHCIPIPAPRTPAVVKIPKRGGGEICVWVKTLAGKAEEVFLSRVGEFYGEFLAVVYFCDESLESAVVHIMGRDEVARLQKRRGEATALRVENLRGLGDWGKLQNAVGAGKQI